MRIISESVIKSNTGKTFIVKKGQIIRVMGESTADFVVFNSRNVKERFDQARTKVDQGKIYVTKGDLLISKFNNVMMTIIEDSYRGTHDMEKGMCSTSFYKKWGAQIFAIYGAVWKKLGRKRGAAPKHGCWENLAKALRPHGVAKEDVPSPLNVFQTMVINARTGSMRYAMIRPKAGGDHMDLRAEMDCLVGISACPEGGRGKDLRVMIYK
ncbi:MAG TPA: urea carboxylase-associated family protein [Candidatus Binatia bacterium]|nr:urea carboxylase-associated family protein [Candidatus Binatia bacterium]